MAIHCHVCASTKGPFSRVKFPSGITSHPYFIKCESCTTKETGITLQNIIGSNPTKRDFESKFCECTQCSALFYCEITGIPKAFSQFNVESCPQCGHALPTGEHLEFQVKNTKRVIGSSHEDSLKEINALYKKMAESVAKSPNLSKVVSNMMIVKYPPVVVSSGKKFPTSYGIWIVHRAGMDDERPICVMLGKCVEDALYFPHRMPLKHALETKRIQIVKKMKADED